MTFLPGASKVLSSATVYLSILIALKQNPSNSCTWALSPLLPYGHCSPPELGYTFASVFKRKQLPKMQVGRKTDIYLMKVNDLRSWSTGSIFKAIPSHLFSGHLMQSLSAREINSLRSEKAVVLSLCSHSKCIFASAGVPKGPKLQQSRQPLAPGEGSETRLNLARKGQMHLDLLSNAHLINLDIDCVVINLGRFNRSGREWGFTCCRLCKLI